MLKVALAGAWHVHFEGYALQVALREDCLITALWDSDCERGRAAAEKFECDFVENLNEMLDRDDVDAVLVCTATNEHPAVISAAAAAGKHIFTEKVLCFDTETALNLKKQVDESGKKFCISFPWRSRGDFQWIKKALDEKLLGELTYCRMRNAHNGASENWLPQTFYDEKSCGGGAMMDLGAHSMYLLNWLMGEAESVSSVFTNVIVNSVEDNAVSVIEYKSGAIGVSETGFVAQNNPFSFEAVGTKGTIFAGGPDNKLVYNIDGEWIEPELPEALENPLDMWVNAIINGGEVPCSTDDALALTRIMEAAYESHKTGRKASL